MILKESIGLTLVPVGKIFKCDVRSFEIHNLKNAQVTIALIKHTLSLIHR